MSEQVWFSLKSICLGVTIGILLDLINGWGRNRSRVYRFWLDVVFGPLAALMLFLGSLIIMDGQLHPLLLFGALAGVFLEHGTVGVYLAKTVVFLRRITARFRGLFAKCGVIFGRWLRQMACVFARRSNKERKMMKKEEK